MSADNPRAVVILRLKTAVNTIYKSEFLIYVHAPVPCFIASFRLV